MAVSYAARSDPRAPLFGVLTEAGRWAALAHVLDYDDLQMPSTTHISAVCVPAALASSGGGRGDSARAYLAGEGGDHLLAGELEIGIAVEDGSPVRATLALPPGAPGRPVTDAELRTKLELCAGEEADALEALTWESAAVSLRLWPG